MFSGTDILSWLSVLTVIAGILVVFLVLRRLVWWYFGIDRLLETLDRIDRRLGIYLENEFQKRDQP